MRRVEAKDEESSDSVLRLLELSIIFGICFVMYA